MEDIRLICRLLMTFLKKTDGKYEEFKSSFISIFENISLFSGEQKAHFNKYLRRKFKTRKDEICSRLMHADKMMFDDEKKQSPLELLNNYLKDSKKNPKFITFVDLRKIFDQMNLVLDADLVEYLIYHMKSSFKSEEVSIYDLNYLALVELLYEENPDDDIVTEDEDQHSYEISPEEYEKIIKDFYKKIKLKADSLGVNAVDVFREDIALVEEESSQQRFKIIELKDFIIKLESLFEIILKELEIYCIYTRLKFDEIENDIEAISWNKLKEDLNNINSKFNMDAKKYKVVSKSIANKKGYKSVSQSQTLKKIDDKKKSNEYFNQSKLSEDLENYLTIEDFKKEIIKNMSINSTFSFKTLFSKDEFTIYENKEVLSYYKFHNTLIEKKIISKKILLEDFSRFLIITKDSEDIVVDIAEIDKFILESINTNVKEKVTNNANKNKILENDKNDSNNKNMSIKEKKDNTHSSYMIENDDEKYEFNDIENENDNYDEENMFNEVN